jgi:hypothetical protein
MPSGGRPTNEGDIELSTESVSQNAGMKYGKLTPISLGLRNMEESEYSPCQSL